MAGAGLPRCSSDAAGCLGEEGEDGVREDDDDAFPYPLHPDVRVGPQARLAHNRHVRPLPSIVIRVSEESVRHFSRACCAGGEGEGEEEGGRGRGRC